MLRYHRRMGGYGKVTLGNRELLALFLEGICEARFLLSLVGIEVYPGLLPRCVYGHVYDGDVWLRNEL